MRLIDGDALAVQIRDKVFHDFTDEFWGVMQCIREAPAIEPERKKGEWILVTDDNGQHYVCDHCGQWRYHQGQKFCSECGLKMEEGEQE